MIPISSRFRLLDETIVMMQEISETSWKKTGIKR